MTKKFWAIVWGASLLLADLVFIPFPISIAVGAIFIVLAYKFEDRLIDWLS